MFSVAGSLIVGWLLPLRSFLVSLCVSGIEDSVS